MEEKTNILEEFKKQIVATVGIIITAAGGLFVANMENIFTPEEDSPPTMEQTITIPPSVVKDTLVITKTVIQKPKKEEREIDW